VQQIYRGIITSHFTRCLNQQDICFKKGLALTHRQRCASYFLYSPTSVW